MRPVEESIEAAIRLLLNDDLPKARELFEETARDIKDLDAERTSAIAKLRTYKNIVRPQNKITREPVRSSDINATFKRDRFTCRYAHCRRRTIYIPVLRQISRILPEVFPYQPNWRPVRDHIIYWMWSTSLEHRVSFPFGGTSEPENLITACYQCNELKNFFPHELLGWIIGKVPLTSDWDGLTRYLPTLKLYGSEEKKMTRASKVADAGACHELPDEGLSVGMLIRAILSGKRQARSYRIDQIQNEQITVTEIWRRAKNGEWVASKNSQTVPIPSLQKLTVRSRVAPSQESPFSGNDE